MSKTSNTTIASFVLGLVSIILCWIPVLPVIGAIVGLVLYSKENKRTGLSTAALVLNIIGLVVSAVYTLIYLFAFAAIASSPVY